MRTKSGSLLGAVVLAALAAAALTAAGAPAAGAKGARLQTFASCGELLGYVKRHATPLVGPWGLGGGAVRSGVPGVPNAARAGTEDYSTTNVQEEGVDEPDLVKSNGRHLFVVAGDRLHVVDARAARPRVVGSLTLEQGSSHELLLEGSKLLVVSRGGFHIEPLPGAMRSIAPIGPARTLLSEIDVRDPASPRVARTLTVEADYVSARLVDGSARIVLVSSMPQKLNFPPPAASDGQAAAAATARNRALIASSGVKSWIPSYVVRSRRGGAAHRRALVQCRHVSHPVGFSGLGLLSVLTIDLAKGLDPVDSDAVLTDGRIVYASPQSLYVATERWSDRPLPGRPEIVPEGVKTALHKFDISDRSQARYRASGEVRGFLLSQWSLSEHRGVLRVASTESPPWVDPAGGRESESMVTTLGEQAGKLVELGQVGGLGRGERIYAVRFLGDLGYVVTFRQVDPLYTLDLGDPRHPALRGELKIQGYSAYLHPLAGDLLLGLGQDASDEGRILGTQLSLFDVSDPRRPNRVQRRTIGPSSSEAEYDHHAFLYWPPSRLAVVPVYAQAADGPFVGAIGFRVGSSGIDEVGRVSHPAAVDPQLPGGGPAIRRSLVVGDRLFTVSDLGVKASSLATLADVGFVAFSQG